MTIAIICLSIYALVMTGGCFLCGVAAKHHKKMAETYKKELKLTENMLLTEQTITKIKIKRLKTHKGLLMAALGPIRKLYKDWCNVEESESISLVSTNMLHAATGILSTSQTRVAFLKIANDVLTMVEADRGS